MASKKIQSVNLKGELSLDDMTVTEVTKEGEFTYDFLSILRGFDGKTISINLKEEIELPVKDE
ncbi:hypothetical protein BAOM_3102 [Peribacillus asahii]|uniref:Bacillus phage SPbeta YonK domain-containing protein n=1 Tax=Peribacillus asahii TaxID=228899 RepID=A0A3Q9RP78_9BACI|nr:YonK family protein [Peribacillus asahii]AZV43711.1 hypothetical protein BAOM_3102 [Peribacillus asahii]